MTYLKSLLEKTLDNAAFKRFLDRKKATRYMTGDFFIFQILLDSLTEKVKTAFFSSDSHSACHH